MSRHDDELLDAPSIVPDTEGRRLREAPSRSASAKPPRSSNSTAPGSGVVRQSVTALAILALGVFCALFYYENAQQKVLNNQLQKRLTDLEAQLGVNKPDAAAGQGETLGEKVTTLDTSLKTAHDEIRKLWGVTNDKNKKALESHDSKLGEHDKSLTSLQNTVTELKKAMAQAEKNAGEAGRSASEAGRKADEGSQAIADMRSSVGAMQQRMYQGDPLVREASQQAAMAQEQAEQLQVKLDALAQRVSGHDESIRSIDSFRRSVSGDLGKLKEQNLQRSPGTQP